MECTGNAYIKKLKYENQQRAINQVWYCLVNEIYLPIYEILSQ